YTCWFSCGLPLTAGAALLLDDLKMCIKYFAFALLWFPGVLHAQSTTQACDAPTLDGGFFAPKQETYSQGTKLSYTCNEGRTLAMKGWWATSTCHNGKWSHQLQCIGKSSTNKRPCSGINNVFESKSNFTESMNACSVPPKIPHAVIVHQDYQEVFAAGSEVQYECEDGYTAEGAHNTKSVCTQGSWTQGPTCRSSNEGDTRLRYTTMHYLSDSLVCFQKYSCVFISVQSCGNFPVIENAVAQQTSRYYLIYRCQRLYRLVGPERVKCISSGTWSNLPECRVNFCAVNTNDNPEYKSVGTVHIENGEEERVECVKPHSWSFEHYSKVRCINGRVEATNCKYYCKLSMFERVSQKSFQCCVAYMLPRFYYL
uniref:Sushi domain-containing protein n=1 Tax=Maylandia zebra TaxID=106582 RepID=A0A3P9BJ07_9CICH